jgi:hypothetical protein
MLSLSAATLVLVSQAFSWAVAQYWMVTKRQFEAQSAGTPKARLDEARKPKIDHLFRG